MLSLIKAVSFSRVECVDVCRSYCIPMSLAVAARRTSDAARAGDQPLKKLFVLDGKLRRISCEGVGRGAIHSYL